MTVRNENTASRPTISFHFLFLLSHISAKRVRQKLKTRCDYFNHNLEEFLEYIRDPLVPLLPVVARQLDQSGVIPF
jgi:hypothetical protein